MSMLTVGALVLHGLQDMFSVMSSGFCSGENTRMLAAVSGITRGWERDDEE